MAAPVEAAEVRQAAGDGGAHAAVGFHGAAGDFEMRAAEVEQGEVVVGAPFGEEPKVGGVADEGVAGVPGQEPGDRCAFGEVERIVDSDEFGGMTVVAMVASLMTQPLRDRIKASTSSRPLRAVTEWSTPAGRTLHFGCNRAGRTGALPGGRQRSARRDRYAYGFSHE